MGRESSISPHPPILPSLQTVSALGGRVPSPGHTRGSTLPAWPRPLGSEHVPDLAHTRFSRRPAWPPKHTHTFTSTPASPYTSVYTRLPQRSPPERPAPRPLGHCICSSGALSLARSGDPWALVRISADFTGVWGRAGRRMYIKVSEKVSIVGNQCTKKPCYREAEREGDSMCTEGCRFFTVPDFLAALAGVSTGDNPPGPGARETKRSGWTPSCLPSASDAGCDLRALDDRPAERPAPTAHPGCERGCAPATLANDSAERVFHRSDTSKTVRW